MKRKGNLMNQDTIRWGIIGCGDVAEVKSGPAFNQIKHSELMAVMRRDTAKAEDFARRHQVPLWYDDYNLLLKNKEINAVYIATPPSSHLEIALKSIEAGKMIYLEKPMVMNTDEATQLQSAAIKTNTKICVAHYRRALPAFVKVKEILDSHAIGPVRLAEIHIRQPLKSNIIAVAEENWRVNPHLSGGGYFYDLAPHQLDLMLHYFGTVASVYGSSGNQSQAYESNDIVCGMIKFQNGVQFNGTWIFNIAENQKEDRCTIYGSKGAISFSFYGTEVFLDTSEGEKTFTFQNPKHIQQPMIQQVVDFFLGERMANPCSVSEGHEVIRMMQYMSK